ncbi:MAG: response regulator [Nitrospiraceae bacterium]|nr:response regulator [Nitrospiraceae bacterium]
MTEQQAHASEEELRKKRLVLVIDSDVRDVHETGMLLQNFGYTVTTVKSAEEALEFFAVAIPHFIVTELQLPGKSGFELIERMRKDQKLASIPVVIQTRLGDIDSESHCRRIGCAGYLRKPVAAEELFRAVQAAVEPTPRTALRVTAFLKASVDGSGQGASEIVTALSDSGLFIKTLNPRPVGSRHTVTFVIAKHIVKAQAQVLYIYGFGEGPHKEPGMGMKFVAISPEDRELIREFIREHLVPLPNHPA